MAQLNQKGALIGYFNNNIWLIVAFVEVPRLHLEWFDALVGCYISLLNIWNLLKFLFHISSIEHEKTCSVACQKRWTTDNRPKRI
jgi:hypothetical protein